MTAAAADRPRDDRSPDSLGLRDTRVGLPGRHDACSRRHAARSAEAEASEPRDRRSFTDEDGRQDAGLSPADAFNAWPRGAPAGVASHL